MSYQWNENSTLIFLNAYKKYPCLWNPYHIKYYNCSAKNEALKNILKELNIPELNISDCLEQIKVIREKYGQEQMRIIERFQSQKPYKSSLTWLPIISEMLAKVIIDEDKLQKGMKTISPNILKNCVTSCKYKNTINFPCAQETKQDYKIKHRKNIKHTKTDKEIYLKNPAILNVKIKEERNNTGLLQCPSCGWEDINSKKLNVTSKEICDQTNLLDNAVPKYTDLADKPYEGYNAYRTGNNTYCRRYNDTIPCPNFPCNFPSYTDYPANNNNMLITTHSYHPQLQGTHNYISPLAKQTGRSIEHRDEGIQNTISVSKTNVTLLSKDATMLQKPNHAVADTIRKCHKKVQTKPFIEELKQVAANTVKRTDKGIQNTICVSRENCNNCQTFEKCSSAIQESKQVGRKTMQCPEDMQNVIEIKFKTVECSVPNFLLISSDRNCVPLKQTDFKLKRSTIDKCQNTDLCQDQKGAEKVCVKGTSRNAIEIIKHNSTLTQALLQYLEKIRPLQEKTKMLSVSSLALKKDDVNSDSFETTICEPRKFANDSTHFATSSAIELESPSCLSCLKETEKDNVIAIFIKTFLELMKHALVSDNRKHTENTQEKCVRKENAIDTFIILNKIKECADNILKIYAAANCSKKRLSNQFCPRYKSKSEGSPKTSLNLNSIQAQVSENSTDQFTAFYENSKDVEVLYGPPMENHSSLDLPENRTTFVEAAVEKKPSVKDKEITAHSENRDIDVTVSASLRNSGTQYTPRQSQDAGVVTEHGQSFEEKISVGTQHESVLLRIIKCNNSGVLLFDKETCVRDAHVACTKNRTATRPVLSSRLSENRLYRKYLIRECYNEELLHPGISHIHEKEMNCIDYRMPSLMNNYRHDKEWRSSLPYNQDWRKVNIPIFGLSSQRASRIPLYTRAHKYTQRRIDRYKMSQSYM
ncbi:uncharacterized protein [Linepithema humile]|uniref:uncharacterized protein isoform X2 n=1 Tax=Linepithema humile TaxID=83485 RepID=UPI00351E7C56